MSKILEAIEALAHNATHPKFITAALTEIKEEIDATKTRLDAIGADASGSTGEAVTALGSRLDSLTTAVSGVGDLVTALAQRVANIEEKPAPATPTAPAVPPVTA